MGFPAGPGAVAVEKGVAHDHDGGSHGGQRAVDVELAVLNVVAGQGKDAGAQAQDAEPPASGISWPERSMKTDVRSGAVPRMMV